MVPAAFVVLADAAREASAANLRYDESVTVRRVVLASVVAAGLVACSLTTGLSGLSGEKDDASDAATPADAATPSDAATPGADVGAGSPSIDAGPDAPPPPNLYPQGTFEIACSGTSYNSTLTASSIAHGGSLSCRVCSIDAPVGTDAFTLDQSAALAAPPKAGSAYHVELWVRLAPDAGAIPDTTVALRTYTTEPGFRAIQEHYSPNLALTADWQKLSTDLLLDQDAPHLSFFVGAGVGAGRCFLVDDVVLTQTK